ncbi:hypothetical protein HanIR_Chr04g0202711 [Helianthus annuus]|nr:hypothetical protein HanIR_Chr04g0202711 [Helianthus annuus]
MKSRVFWSNVYSRVFLHTNYVYEINTVHNSLTDMFSCQYVVKISTPLSHFTQKHKKHKNSL